MSLQKNLSDSLNAIHTSRHQTLTAFAEELGEKVSLTPALSSRPECLSESKVCVDRSDSLSHHLLEAIVLAAHLMSLITRVSYLQYRIFSCHGSVKGEENVSFTYHIF